MQTGGAAMARKSARSVLVDPNVRCMRIYPVEETNREVKDLKTVGIKLSREQAIHLARVLLAVSQEWNEIDITGYRLEKRTSDGTYHLTVTSPDRKIDRPDSSFSTQLPRTASWDAKRCVLLSTGH